MLKRIRQQGSNYWKVLKWLLSGYYRQEKVSFWLIQALMCTSVLTGLAWLLGVIAGLSYLNDPNFLTKYNISLLIDFFSMPLWIWVAILSLCGLVSALTQFISYTVGVNSVIRYQEKLVVDGLSVLSTNNTDWAEGIQESPKSHLNRVLKMGVQMSGLVIRRLVRMLIPMVTLFASVVALIKLNSTLLLLMVPLFLLYLVALYFINRRAARNQVQLVGLSKSLMPKLGALIEEMFDLDHTEKSELKVKLQKSEYRTFSFFRYKRRLAEIHVAWLNSLFLVLGSALIIFVEGTGNSEAGVNWGQLILFVIALRYAGGGLQEMASSTVAFSRFLPETELLYQLLHAPEIKPQRLQGVVYALNLTSVSDACLRKIIGQKYVIRKSIVLGNKDGQKITGSEMLAEGFCITSKRPLKFKQAVKKSNPMDSILVYGVDGSLDVFSKETFLENYDSIIHPKIEFRSMCDSDFEKEY